MGWETNRWQPSALLTERIGIELTDLYAVLKPGAKIAAGRTFRAFE